MKKTIVKVNWKDNDGKFHSYVAISNVKFNQYKQTLTFTSKEDDVITIPISELISISQFNPIEK